MLSRGRISLLERVLGTKQGKRRQRKFWANEKRTVVSFITRNIRVSHFFFSIYLIEHRDLIHILLSDRFFTSSFSYNRMQRVFRYWFLNSFLNQRADRRPAFGRGFSFSFETFDATASQNRFTHNLRFVRHSICMYTTWRVYSLSWLRGCAPLANTFRKCTLQAEGSREKISFRLATADGGRGDAIAVSVSGEAFVCAPRGPITGSLCPSIEPFTFKKKNRRKSTQKRRREQ